VIAGFSRGWVFAQFLSMPFQNQPILIGNAGGWLGVPLISFSVGPYWDIHYRNRPWWNQRNQWVGRPPHHSWGPPSARPLPWPQPRPPIAHPRPPRPQPPIAQPPPEHLRAVATISY